MNYEKYTRPALMFALIISLGIALPCYAETGANKTSAKDVKKESRDLLQALKSYSANQRDTAILKTKAALEKLDQRIDALEGRIHKNWDNLDQAARKKARASLKALRKQRTQVAESYESLKSSSVDAWDHMKQGFSDAYRNLLNSWEKVESEFEAGKKSKSGKTSK